MVGYVTEVQVMAGGGYSFGISDDRRHTARTWLVYPTNQKAAAARNLVEQALATAKAVQGMP